MYYSHHLLFWYFILRGFFFFKLNHISLCNIISLCKKKIKIYLILLYRRIFLLIKKCHSLMIKKKTLVNIVTEGLQLKQLICFEKNDWFYLITGFSIICFILNYPCLKVFLLAFGFMYICHFIFFFSISDVYYFIYFV